MNRPLPLVFYGGNLRVRHALAVESDRGTAFGLFEDRDLVRAGVRPRLPLALRRAQVPLDLLAAEWIVAGVSWAPGMRRGTRLPLHRLLPVWTEGESDTRDPRFAAAVDLLRAALRGEGGPHA